MCGDCNWTGGGDKPITGIKYETYTPQSMRKYLEGLAIAKYQGWKKEEGYMQPTGQPWVSFENPEGTWMHHYWLDESGRMTLSQFNSNQTINLRVTNNEV